MNQANLLNDRKFLMKYMTSYSILVIIILVMGLYMYKLGIDDAKSNLFKQSYIILSQSVSNMDNAFRSMETLSMQERTFLYYGFLFSTHCFSVCYVRMQR